METLRSNSDDQLDALFQAYRAACPDREASPNFMPELWKKIEARQSFAFSFRRMANALVTAAMAASVALGVYMAMPHRSAANPNYYATYEEALAEANTLETPGYVAPIRFDLSDSQ